MVFVMYQTWGQIHVNEYKYVFANKQILSFKYFQSTCYMNTFYVNANKYSEIFKYFMNTL